MSIGSKFIVNNNLRYYKLSTSRVLGQKFPSCVFRKIIILLKIIKKINIMNYHQNFQHLKWRPC
jgi:hypothetical protein